MADYVKLPEVARRLDISEKTARRMVKAGKLPALFIGNAYRVSEEDLEKYLESAKVEPGKAPRRSQFEPSFEDVLADERSEADITVHLKDIADAQKFISDSDLRRVSMELLDDGSVVLRGYRT